MRRYLSPIMAVVTLSVALSLAGCAGTSTTDTKGLRTPSGAQIGDRLPNFNPTPDGTGAAPMATTTNGRSAVSPYYQLDTTDATASAAAAKELPPVKMAILVPLSGPQGALGQALVNAAQLALFDSGASNITLIPQDTTTGASKAATAALDEGAQIILGPLFAQDVKAVSPIARGRNVPVIAFSTDWTAVSPNTYIMGFLPFGQVARVVDFATKRGAKNISALIPQTPYGAAVNGTLKNETRRQNLSAPNAIVFSQNGLPSAVQQLSQTGKNTDALLLPVGGVQLTQAATQLRQNDWNFGRVHILGTGLWDDSPQATSLLPGGWYAAPDPKLRVAFNNQYRDTYGQPAPRLATLAYDATALAAALALKGLRENGAPAYSRENLTNPNGFAGLDGVFRFRPDGLAERGLAVLELRATGAVVVDPAPTRF